MFFCGFLGIFSPINTYYVGLLCGISIEVRWYLYIQVSPEIEPAKLRPLWNILSTISGEARRWLKVRQVHGCFLKYRCRKACGMGGMFWKYDSGHDSPDASKRGFKTMGMIRGHDSGYDSRQCNVPVVINSVYAVPGNTHMGVSYWNVGNPVPL